MSDPVVVYIDVDDTLIRTSEGKRNPVSATVQLVHRLHGEGAELYLWSAGGGTYAREVATELGLEKYFCAFLSKPEILVDDLPIAEWWMEELHPDEVNATTNSDSFRNRLLCRKHP